MVGISAGLGDPKAKLELVTELLQYFVTSMSIDDFFLK